jgi:TonB family protein
MTSARMDWVDRIAASLIRCAARRAPDPWPERLEEEWLADLPERRGRLSRLRFAIGCCWATSVIAFEHGLATVPATGAAVAHGTLAGHAHGGPPLFPRRTLTFLLVACLHAVVLYGLVMGVTSQIKVVIPAPLVPRFIPSTPHTETPATPGPHISTMPFPAPKPLDMPPIEPEPPDGVQGTIHETPRPEAPPLLPPAVNRVQGGPGTGFPSSDDFYPSIAIYHGEKGAATVKACVDGKGRLTSEPSIVESTGFSRLDDAALKLARAGSGHYRASTEDGRPVNSCYPFRIRFELRN